MSKGPTKAQQALTEAREWVEASKEEVKEREAALVEAQGQLVMHETIYAILEKTLTRQSSAKSTTKKSSKKSSKGGSKSARAQSLSGVIQRTPKSKADDDNDDDGDGKGMGGPLCQTCGNFRQYQDHFKPSPNYHEFDAGKSSTSAAQPARGKSSTNGGAGSEADLGGERLDAIRAASGE